MPSRVPGSISRAGPSTGCHTLNPNKLFPRLSIRIKLVIAFAAVSLIPLAVVSLLGARATVAHIEATARGTLSFDLDLAEQEVSRTLAAATIHVEFLSSHLLAELLTKPRTSERRLLDVERVAKSLIETEPTLLQVKVIDTEGSYRLVLRREGRQRGLEGRDGGQFYAWMAAGLPPGGRAFLSVEVAVGGRVDLPDLVRCVAIIVPVHDRRGELVGVVVGEAYAHAIFTALERASAGFQGVTGVVDDRGLFLYHSSRQPAVATPLAEQRQIVIADDVGSEQVAQVTSGAAGSAVTDDGRLVSYRSLRLGTDSSARLSLYRVIPLETLRAPGRSFLFTVLGMAPLVVVVVLALASVAAEQFTRPILRVRKAVWRLARGEPLSPPDVETNDELEDLAVDFHEVSRQVTADRVQREAMMAERTQLLERTRSELGELLAHSADAIVSLDALRRIRTWNGGAESLFGWRADEVIGANLDELLFGATAGGSSAIRARAEELARRGALVNVLQDVTARSGERIPVGISETVLRDGAGEVLGTSLIMRDHRERERLEQHLRRSERLSAMSVMAAGLAHELNNPLAILGNRVECMQRDARRASAPAAWLKDLEVLGDHVTRISGLTSSLLAFARDDERTTEPISLPSLAMPIVALLRQTFAMRGLELAVDFAPDVPTITVNAKAIETVLVNLLLNAADATPAGGKVTLGVRATAAGGVEFDVSDTGSGIPVEQRGRVFEPFYTTKGVGRGTGLGLAVCRSVVDRHGGTIRISDAPGGGARFVVTLPHGL